MLPSEVERIELQLLRTLESATLPQLADLFVGALECRPPQVAEQVRAAVGSAPMADAASSWREECSRLAAAVVQGLQRLYAPRLLGMGVYAVTNRLLGERGVEALHWAQQTQTAAALLAQHAWLPWAQWLCQLPLPSLRDGGWLEPLIAALPIELIATADALDTAHAYLHAALTPPSSPVRLLLLATAWVLWIRRQPSPRIEPPGSLVGRSLVSLPGHLEQLDRAGQAVRRLFAAPPPEGAAATHARAAHPPMLLPIAAATASLLPAQRQVAGGTVPLAAVGLALAGLADGSRAAAVDATTQDPVTMIEGLWQAWDESTVQDSVRLSGRPFDPTPEGPYRRALQQVRDLLATLYHQDDFLGALYTERVPPATLQMRNTTLTGQRVHSQAPVQLHPIPNSGSNRAWSIPTAALLTQLATAVAQAGGCYVHAEPRLDCALQFQLGEAVSDSSFTTGALAVLIQRVERSLPHRPAATAHRETLTLRWLRARIMRARDTPVRGLEPAWPSGRPDPRSHLGDNLRLARSMLSLLSAHPTLVALCAAGRADPDQLAFPAVGDVTAMSRQGNRSVVLFRAEHPPWMLAPLAIALSGLATLLHAPVRSSGMMRVPEMLAYYKVPWPDAPLDDAQYAACLAALDQRLTHHLRGLPKNPPVPSAPSLRQPAERPAARPVQQATVNRLWELFEAAPPATPLDLGRHRLPLPAGTRPARAWALSQERLLRLFEAVPLWLALRQADASFRSLRVASGRVLASTRAHGRGILLNTTGWADTSAELRALFHVADQFGCITTHPQVPLSSVLSFHGIARRPPQQACQPHWVDTAAQRLQLLHQIHLQWSPHADAAPVYQQATGDLHDIRQTLAAVRDNNRHYRPSLGTASAGPAYEALGPFALLLQDPDLQRALADVNVTSVLLSIDTEGLLSTYTGNGSTHPLSEAAVWTNVSRPSTVLDGLSDRARRAGRSLRSDARVEMREVLSAHGDCGNGEDAGTDALRHCSERILGELRLGMRPHLLHAQDLLDVAQTARLCDAVQQFLRDHATVDMSLLEYLGTPLVEDGRFAWHEVDRISFVLSELVRSPRARVLQQRLLKELGWYGGGDWAMTSPTLLGSLTVCALVADLGPPSDRDARIILGYRLHKYANRGRTFAQIREDLHHYLYSLGRVPPALRAMAARLVLQEEVPELWATDIPEDLIFGSAIAPVSYVAGVHTAERIQRGLSQRMNFSTLLTLSADLASDTQVPAEVQQMALDARRLPMLDWLVFRQLEQGPLDASTAAGQVDAAMRHFDERILEIETAVTDLLAPPPYRMAMVKSELERVFPSFPGPFAGLGWNTTQLRLCRADDAVRRTFPLFELVAADAVQHGPLNWSLCSVPEPLVQRAQGYQGQDALKADAYAQMQQRFGRLADIAPRFEAAFNAYFANATRGYGVLIEEALYRRPVAERMAIIQGNVTIYTLRTHEPQLEAQQETPADTDPYRLRFGVLYCLEGNRCFQLFPLQSRILPLPLDGELPIGGRLESRKVRLRDGHYGTIAVRRGRPLGVDDRAYASNDAPEPGRTSSVIVEPLRFNASLLDAATPNVSRSPFHAVVAPLQQAFFWLDPVAFRHQARSPTRYEAHLADQPLWLNAVEFIVPFVGNLRKLSSTDRDEFAMAAFGLYLEGVLMGPVGSSLAKVLARPGRRMTMPRFKEVAKVLGRGTLDALNPLSGLPALTRLGVGVVQRGARGDLHFIWSRIRRPAMHAPGGRWSLRDGMAVQQEGTAPPLGSLHFSVRTVENIRNVMVVSSPSSDALRAFHLLDPATLTPYGPLLQQRLDSGTAAGMLLKVGDGLRPPRPSPGKMLKPIKQGARASQEASSESREADHPQDLDLADPFLRRPAQRTAQGSGDAGG